ncbi:MAG: hypothetical protein AAFX93_01110 [Verrucomicrobiota bacterium]
MGTWWIVGIFVWWVVGFVLIYGMNSLGLIGALDFDGESFVLMPLLPFFWPIVLLMVFLQDRGQRDELKQVLEEHDAAERTIELEERKAQEAIESLYGESGRVTVALKPVGKIEVAGQVVEARADLGMVERHTTVVVKSHNGSEYVVESR